MLSCPLSRNRSIFGVKSKSLIFGNFFKEKITQDNVNYIEFCLKNKDII